MNNLDNFIENKLKLINKDPEKQKLLKQIITELKDKSSNNELDDNILANVLLAIIYNEDNETNIDITKYLNDKKELSIDNYRIEKVDPSSIIIEMNKGMELMTWYNILNKTLNIDCNMDRPDKDILSLPDSPNTLGCESTYNKIKEEKKDKDKEDDNKISELSKAIGYNAIDKLLTTITIKYKRESKKIYIFKLKRMKTLTEFKKMSKELLNIDENTKIDCTWIKSDKNSILISTDKDLTEIINTIFDDKIQNATFMIKKSITTKDNTENKEAEENDDEQTDDNTENKEAEESEDEESDDNTESESISNSLTT